MKRRRRTLELDVARKFLKQTGGSIKAIVLSRLPGRSAAPGKKAPPVSTRLCVVSTDNEVVYTAQQEQGESLPPYQLAQSASVWYGAFDLDPKIDVGSLVTLVKPRASMYQGTTRLSGTLTLLSPASPQMLDKELPDVLMKLPSSLQELYVQENIVSVFNPSEEAKVKFKTVAYMQGYSGNVDQIYCGRKRSGETYKTAYIADFGGYPVEFEDNNRKAYAVVCFYDKNFEDLGIVCTQAWQAFAPIFFDYFTGYLFSYVDTQATKAMQSNMLNGACGEGGSEPDAEDKYSFVATLRCNRLVYDVKEMVQKIGFEVDADYVKDFFDGRTYVESAFAQSNKLWLNKATSPVLNLSEYNGTLDHFYNSEEGQWLFYALVGYDSSRMEERAVEMRQNKYSNHERGVMLKDPTRFHFNKQYIYAVRK